MDFALQGQRVLVTGGASGIGRAIAEAFGRCGAHVVFTYFSSEEAAAQTVTTIEASGGKALALYADLTQEAEVAHVISRAVEQFGGIDVLVANTGGLLQRSKVADCSLELWNQALAVNLTSVFLCCRAVLPHMERAGRGCIITMSSLAAHDGGGAGSAHYAASKGAVLTFTRSLAKEVGPLGIRVNGIAPGLIATRFHDTFSTPEGRQATVNRTPLHREGLPEDVAGIALFLASPHASFIAGETIEVNGGQGVF
ncbi:oxidoreductase [Reticulibacter mediterranei]|uniref:Oxidoreductase n=1 Tax=Reticulibacter mediterranei TaxID=2778369 RepID=A0A8J3I7Q5_9CHLR|nr:SDR family NAD(P)-dependent oxidoreductase [Reticulibacter mediterranei]GHO90374.1 oxidoreductase [Reticulibacter mediterranei]